jgi:cell division protein FtsI (penicillin-binding protein 3)
MQNRPLSVREIFLHSSNIGAGMLALAAGSERQQAFLEKLGLLTQMRWDGGAVAPPLLPKHWGRAETITVAYGHGIAVSPLQFAAAVTPLINGGYKISPTLTLGACEPGKTALSVSAATSSKIREIMRLNVTNAAGTGRRAEAAGYRVGGKTGTAEMPSRGGYQEKAVISSFVGAFPMDEPQYLTFVLLFEPEAAEGVAQGITGGLNAAPTTARIVERVAPLLGVLPRLAEAHWPEGSPFDALPAAQ